MNAKLNNANLNNDLNELVKAMLSVDKAEAGYEGAVAALVPHMKASAKNHKAIFEAVAKHYGIATGPSERDNEWGNVTLKKGDSDARAFRRAENRWEYIKKAWRNDAPAKPGEGDTAKPATDPVAALVGNVSKALAKMSAAQRTRALKAIAKLA